MLFMGFRKIFVTRVGESIHHHDGLHPLDDQARQAFADIHGDSTYGFFIQAHCGAKREPLF